MQVNFMTGLIGATAALTAFAAHAQLVATDGGLGVYDPTNKVTCTPNANLFATQATSYSGGAAAFVSAVILDSGGVIYDTPNSYDPTGTYTLSATDFNTSSGQMDGLGAQSWVHDLDVTDYGGSNQWAPPPTLDYELCIILRSKLCISAGAMLEPDVGVVLRRPGAGWRVRQSQPRIMPATPYSATCSPICSGPVRSTPRIPATRGASMRSFYTGTGEQNDTTKVR